MGVQYRFRVGTLRQTVATQCRQPGRKLGLLLRSRCSLDLLRLQSGVRPSCPALSSRDLLKRRVSADSVHPCPGILRRRHLELWRRRSELQGSVGTTSGILFRSWLDVMGTARGQQMTLMRHADISTTMNVYRAGLMDSNRVSQSCTGRPWDSVGSPTCQWQKAPHNLDLVGFRRSGRGDLNLRPLIPKMARY